MVNQALSIPFSEFFDNYFRDESGNLPSNNGYRFFFVDSMNTKEWSKFSRKAGEIEQKNNFQINLTNAHLVYDSSITGNFGCGIYLVVGDKPLFTLKDLNNDWRELSEVRKIEYDEDDKRLYIKDFKFTVHSEDRLMIKRFIECFNAYINQNNTPKKAEVKNMEAKPLVQVLGNIDNRIQELEEKREKLLAFEE